MSITETQLAPPKPNRGRHQFSLRALVGLTLGIAAFFSLTSTHGVAAVVVAMDAILILVVIEYLREVRPLVDTRL